MIETLQDKINRVIKEDVEIVQYDPQWPDMFDEEKAHLYQCLPEELIRRIEHFGSTAIPELAAKPIIDILVEVTSLKRTKELIVPILKSQEYDYFWRPTRGNNTPPFYAWFIKRNSAKIRSHHIHMIESNFEHWDRLFFRDYLREYPEIAKQYQGLKIELSKKYPNDRIAYTKGKTEFIVRITDVAKKYYNRDDIIS